MMAFAQRLRGKAMLFILFADWVVNTDSLTNEEKP
jgi:hypothetical protein